MTLFAIFGGLLVLLALVMLVPPLLRQHSNPDREMRQQINTAKSELRSLKKDFKKGLLKEKDYLEKRRQLGLELLDNVDPPTPQTLPPVSGRWAAVVTAIAIPVLALGLYFKIGQPGLIADSQTPTTARTMGQQNNPPPVDEMIDGLKKKLEDNPQNAEGWFMLGRAYMLMKDYPNAVGAIQKTLELTGEDPNILMRLADATAMQNNGRVSGEPAMLLKRALAIDPNHGEALWLAGIAAEESGDSQQAIQHWQRAKISMANDPDSIQMLDEAIRKIQAEAGISSSTSNLETTSTAATATATTSISVKVSLADSFKGKVSADDNVFIFAKASSGPPMPLAAEKSQVKDLPITVTLDDSKAMMPNMKLSDFDSVIVGARISKSGNPIKQSGDLEGLTQALRPSSDTAVSVKIDQIVK